MIHTVEIRNGKRVNSELGELGSEDKPDNKSDGTQYNNKQNNKGEDAAETGGATGGVWVLVVILLVVRVILVTVVAGCWRRGCIRVTRAGQSWIGADGVTVGIGIMRRGRIAYDRSIRVFHSRRLKKYCLVFRGGGGSELMGADGFGRRWAAGVG
ncbi:Hypothetical predicted protein [Olea europaea subsp. europaea]|uniref:Uncharacterized protein n=1 Tax=Olea europaea subsp. europaea TaxID=158383 RepID=A0A8S0T506_OLEEU|nr:Hypothetical predicted protein [Olea europaea subsp. europaea]